MHEVGSWVLANLTHLEEVQGSLPAITEADMTSLKEQLSAERERSRALELKLSSSQESVRVNALKTCKAQKKIGQLQSALSSVTLENEKVAFLSLFCIIQIMPRRCSDSFPWSFQALDRNL